MPARVVGVNVVANIQGEQTHHITEGDVPLHLIDTGAGKPTTLRQKVLVGQVPFLIAKLFVLPAIS